MPDEGEQTNQSPSNEAAALLLWGEALRMLQRQEANLDTLRNQAVAVLSVASVVAGLFGSRLLPGSHSLRVEAAIWIALILFGVSALLAIFILIPRKWGFSHDLQESLSLIKARHPIAVISLAHRWATGFEQLRRKNQGQLDGLMRCFWLACVLVGAQVIAWAVAVA